MGKADAYNVYLNGQQFKTKTAAQLYVRSKIKDFNPADPIWFELLDLHPEKEQKIGSGVKEFFLSNNRFRAHVKQLNIRRVDGSEIDISWQTCVNNEPIKYKQNLLSAMRRAVFTQIQEFKSKNGTTCTICNITVAQDQVHADHIKPFNEIANEFIIAAGPYAPPSFDDCEETHSAILKKEHAEYERAWSAWHKEQTTLRITCAQCNLRRKRK